MVGAAAAGTVLASGGTHAVGVFFAVLEIVVFASWALMFAVLFGLLIYITVLRGQRQRRKQLEPAPAPAADPRLPAVLSQARAVDPHFDERLLLEASQLICLVIFAAMSTGDEEPVRRFAAPSFWSTLFGRYVRASARSARMQRVQEQSRRGGSRRQARLPLDFQALAPELISLEFSPQQRVCVRVTFSQLRAVVAPGAARQTAMASATSLSSLAAGFGGAMAERMNNGDSVPGLSWLSWAGKYDLVFTRPAGARTDPRAAVSSRNCARCGAAYTAELATACAHCHAPRPLAWDPWRLADIVIVDE